MPRGSRRSGGRSPRSGGGFFGRSKTQTSQAKPATPAPAPVRVASAPAPAPMAPSSGGGMMSGLGSTIMQGLAFGTGSAVAHRAVDAVAGPRTVQHEWTDNGSAAGPAPAASAPVVSQAASNACMNQQSAFDTCMRDNSGNVSACQFYFDLLSQCQRK